MEGFLRGLHCSYTCLKDKKHEGAVRAELFHEGEELGAEGESSTSHALADGGHGPAGAEVSRQSWVLVAGSIHSPGQGEGMKQVQGLVQSSRRHWQRQGWKPGYNPGPGPSQETDARQGLGAQG